MKKYTFRSARIYNSVMDFEKRNRFRGILKQKIMETAENSPACGCAAGAVIPQSGG